MEDSSQLCHNVNSVLGSLGLLTVPAAIRYLLNKLDSDLLCDHLHPDPATNCMGYTKQIVLPFSYCLGFANRRHLREAN